MTECPKCKRNTVIKATTMKKTKVKEKKGLFHLIIWIILFPFWGLWVLLFGRKRENFHKENKWNCRYCNHTWKDEGDEA